MDIPSHLLPDYLVYLGMGLFFLVLLGAVGTAPWFKIRDNDSLHVFLGAVVFLLVIWTMKAGIQPGLNFHLLGATALCLMFGWQFAFMALSLVIAGHALNGDIGWDVVPINALIMGGIPLLVTSALLRLAQRHLPLNYFVYIFVNAFFTAGLSSLAVALTSYVLYRYTNTYPLNILHQQYLPFMLLIALPESTLNGITMTGMVVYRPEWVATFHDRCYLYRK